MSLKERNLYNVAVIIRNDLKAMKDTILWSLQASNLTTDKIVTANVLALLLNAVLSELPTKQNLKGYLVKAVSYGIVKASQTILYPYLIKTLSIDTELIKVTKRLTYGTSYNLLEETETETAYRTSVMSFGRVFMTKFCHAGAYLF